MTFDEIDQKLPNGFHDSKIRAIKSDFVDRSVLISMDLLVGLPDTPNPEGYRAGTLKLVSPYLFIVEAPDPSYSFVPDGSPLNTSGYSVKLGENVKLDPLLQRLPIDTITFGFFLEGWNSYINLACASIEFFWDDGGAFG